MGKSIDEKLPTLFSYLSYRDAAEDLHARPAEHGIYVYVSDVVAHYQRAKAAEAHIVFVPEDTEWGTRRYRALDPEGYEWSFGNYRLQAAP